MTSVWTHCQRDHEYLRNLKAVKSISFISPVATYSSSVYLHTALYSSRSLVSLRKFQISGSHQLFAIDVICGKGMLYDAFESEVSKRGPNHEFQLKLKRKTNMIPTKH